MAFLDFYLEINQNYAKLAPSVALVMNHENICDLRDSQVITQNDFECLVSANRMAYEAYTKYPKEF